MGRGINYVQLQTDFRYRVAISLKSISRRPGHPRDKSLYHLRARYPSRKGALYKKRAATLWKELVSCGQYNRELLPRTWALGRLGELGANALQPVECGPGLETYAYYVMSSLPCNIILVWYTDHTSGP
ncbi:hypothetical protein PG996_006107 [Apiospora saccharicola]|uniref:Uncharacterized protein n=1 Tax=Apiospora saccharicola TaxID=335842 RepID=A0ABR1VND1_9PEZI